MAHVRTERSPRTGCFLFIAPLFSRCYFASVGTLRLVVVPSPSCPFWLEPQQYVDPALVEPQT